MKSRFLFSHKFKALGWVLFSLGFVFGLILRINEYSFDDEFMMPVFAIINEAFMEGEGQFFTVIDNGIIDELISILIIVGGILVVFSKAKIEDEFIARIRMESLKKLYGAPELLII